MKTKHHNYFTATALAALLSCSVSSAQAEITFYNSQAAYLAAISAPAVDRFDDLPFWAQGPGYLERTAGEHSYVAWSVAGPGEDSLLYSAGSAGDAWLSTDQASDYLTFGYFSKKVYGIGGFFFGTDEAGAYLPGQTIRLNVLAADGVEQLILVDNTTTGSFFGFVSTSRLDAFQVSAVQPNGGYSWVAANDLTLGSVAAVPEPASYALLMAGLGLVGAAARRRKA
ncbi:PEP-CTERM sorting domain-containing protein [Roseateles oligotrophus]|uniref:PEPxxWA-CTERM sorting domain-containing protein n=1 Tax=Roseateles oligotrophus TaxID=1769250 RepID=A0ABT2YDH1_9BURK|nr:PEP-CTERM sorting domain-containing protein [Roseateles oligotrophus]MCV2368099.1 PEPxxWA-CTERM sorting domain-containing protein [Roseateles oligotrophus]